jgi:hypothetical protein
MAQRHCQRQGQQKQAAGAGVDPSSGVSREPPHYTVDAKTASHAWRWYPGRHYLLLVGIDFWRSPMHSLIVIAHLNPVR